MLIKEGIRERRENFPLYAEKNNARRKLGLGRVGKGERQSLEIEGHPKCQQSTCLHRVERNSSRQSRALQLTQRGCKGNESYVYCCF